MDQFVIAPGPPGQVTLCCHGTLELACRDSLSTACSSALARADTHLVVDLDDVDFLDCASVRLLADTARLQRDRGGSFTVVCSDAFVLRVLALTGFSAQHRVVRAHGGSAVEADPLAG